MFLVLVISVLLISAILYGIGRLKRHKASRKIPSPSFWYIIPFQGFNGIQLFKIIGKLQRLYGNLIDIRIFNRNWMIISDPTIVEKILNDQRFLKAKEYEFLKPWLGSGLLLCDGKKWFERRRALTPAFHFKILNDFVKIFEKQTNILIEKFRDNKIVDVTKYFPIYTLDSICETAMGININMQNGSDPAYHRAMSKVAGVCCERIGILIYHFDCIFKFTRAARYLEESLKIVYDKTQTVIKQKREQLGRKLKNQKVNNDESDIEGRKKMALLDILLQTTIKGQPLTDKDIEEEVNTFMFAGHDTTSSASGFLLYNIARHPEVQEKLIHEIWDIVGRDKSVEITMSMLNEFRYLDLVIKESLRLHTPVPWIGRQILEEVQINDYIFPAKTNFYINVYGMCHTESLFPDSERFIPERFETIRSANTINPYAYIPFSAGPRNCLGQKYAMLELKMMAVKVLLNFQIFLARPNEELILSNGLVLKATNGIHIQFKDRE